LGPGANVDVTERRTNHDFAHQMRGLVDRHFPDTTTIRVVLDNLNTHTPAALYEAYRTGRGPTPPPEARLPLHAGPRQLAQYGRDTRTTSGSLGALVAIMVKLGYTVVWEA
jgi:hypothetical protein